MTPSIPFDHEMLVANAGSGKTYALTNRIIRLMLAGVPIHQIAALTFTRKSAGEFLDELLLRLADAALEPDKLRSLAQSVGQADLNGDDCSRLLRHIIDHFGQLGLGTIDSFFARIARQFPLESGLPEDFAIADSASLASARERALAAGFTRSASESGGLNAMIEQCRQITRRQGERHVFGTLLKHIEALHQCFLATPPDCTWGDAHAIWSGYQQPFPAATDKESAIDQFEQAVLAAKPDLNEEARGNLHSGLAAIRALNPGQTWSGEVQKFAEQKLSSNPKDNHIRFAAKKADGWVELTPEVQTSRQALLHTLYADALLRILDRSQGLYQFVRHYETVYSDLVRNMGLISFSDITILLAERAGEADTAAALEWRNQVAYRIDQRFDHWLLDEFQDTSRLQWAILRTFIEEAIMDDAAQRSFFYVGDTKQAIYGWRGGDAELFREIFDYYDSIQAAQPLTDSWRSTEPVIEMVNCVFGNVSALAKELKLPRETVTRWQLGWNTHTVAPPRQHQPGYAIWHAVEKDPDNEDAPQHAGIMRILETVEPLSRGIECAVLLRKNQDVATLAAYLQARGIAVAVEGKSNPCIDNFLGRAVLAGLRAVAHPGDAMAAATVRGLPCAQAWGIEKMDTFRERTLRSIAENGFAATIDLWIEAALTSQIPNPKYQFTNTQSEILDFKFQISEPFLQSRADALLSAAEAYDAKYAQGEGIDAFIAHIESLEIQEAEGSEAIRIMTVHQAKGLGFEMVIVAGLDRPGNHSTADELVLGPDMKHPRWGLLLPRKDIAEHDPLLQMLTERLAAESKTNELCSAYVALTRAKRALYVISDALDDKTKASHFGRHLQLALGKDWETGDPEWYR